MYKYMLLSSDPESSIDLCIYHEKKFTHDEFLDIVSKAYKFYVDKQEAENVKHGFYWPCDGWMEITRGLYAEDGIENVLCDKYGFIKEEPEPVEVSLQIGEFYNTEERQYIDNHMDYLNRECVGKCINADYERELWEHCCPKFNKKNNNGLWKGWWKG
jgi:hypothetical protein